MPALLWAVLLLWRSVMLFKIFIYLFTYGAYPGSFSMKRITLLCLAMIQVFLFYMPVSARENDGKVLELLIRSSNEVGGWSRNYLKEEMLRLALEKSREKYGDYVVRVVEYPVKQSRVIEQIQLGGPFRVICTMTSAQRELDLWPIRIPVYKGLMGYRVLIIRAEDQSLYNKVTNLQALKAFVGVQGHDWPDADILQTNGLQLYRSPSYLGAFNMLKFKRVDYFPRGIHEAWDELRNAPGDGLAVENTILLYYPAPMYFFVRRGDTELHQRIREGLLMAKADGSFDQLFYNHPDVRDVFNLSNMRQRKVFPLKNIGLSEYTPLDKKSWWYQIGDELSYFSDNDKRSGEK